MDESLEMALSKSIALLEENGYRYAVVGGLATQVWGTVRATRDVDIKVLIPDTDYAEARDRIRATYPERARPEVPPSPLIVDAKVGNVTVDFLLAAPGYEENIITRAVSCKLGSLSLWVCSAEDLVIQKVIASRPRDWQDIDGILGEQYGKLDRGYLEFWLKQLADAFSEPEVFSRYQDVQNRIDTIMQRQNKN